MSEESNAKNPACTPAAALRQYRPRSHEEASRVARRRPPATKPPSLWPCSAAPWAARRGCPGPPHGPAAHAGLRRGARRRRRARRTALRPKEAPHRDAVHRRGLPARRPLLAGDDLRRHALRERPPPRDARRSRRGVPRPRRWSNDETPGTKLAGKSFEVQATAALQNLRAVLEAAGASPKQLVSVRAGVGRDSLRARGTKTGARRPLGNETRRRGRSASTSRTSTTGPRSTPCTRASARTTSPRGPSCPCPTCTTASRSRSRRRPRYRLSVNAGSAPSDDGDRARARRRVLGRQTRSSLSRGAASARS